MGEAYDRLMKGEIKWDSLSPMMKILIDSDSYENEISGKSKDTLSIGGLWDDYVAPVMTNEMERIVNDKNVSDVYTDKQIDEIFSEASKLPKTTTHVIPEILNKEKAKDAARHVGRMFRMALKPYVMEDERNFVPKVDEEHPKDNDNASGPSHKMNMDDLRSKIGDAVRKIRSIPKPVLIGTGIGAAGLTAGAAALVAAAIMRNRKSRRRNAVKKAAWYDSMTDAAKSVGRGIKAVGAKAGTILPDSAKGRIARWRVPEIDLIDRAMQANSKGQYSGINEEIRKMLEKRTKDISDQFDDGRGSLGKFMASFDHPFFLPGDGTTPYGSSLQPNSKGLDAVQAQTRPEGKKPLRGISPDPRVAPLTAIAATMLPGTYYDKEEPSISNMAYAMPFVTGQYAKDTGMTTNDIMRVTTNGLDRAVMDSIKYEMAKYPAWKNVISAYANGGFGDSSDQQGFGLKRPFWDYEANAPTPEGTNMVDKVVNDIALAGGYGGREPDMIQIKNDDGETVKWMNDLYSPYGIKDENGNVKTDIASKRDLHRRELLRFLDEVGPSVLMPKTVLGRRMLDHPAGGIIPNAEMTWHAALPYIEKDPFLLNNLNLAIGGGAIGRLIGKLKDKAIEAQKESNQESENDQFAGQQ